MAGIMIPYFKLKYEIIQNKNFLKDFADSSYFWLHPKNRGNVMVF